MQRIPEPELMNDPAQAHAYAHADFETPHQLFIDTFQQKFPELNINDAVLDLGCGPCDISRRFATAYPNCSVHAVDGAANMLSYASKLNAAANLHTRIELINGTLPDATLPQNFYHTIISNSLLHHLHNPFVLWQTVQQHTRPPAHIFIMDLVRPASETAAKKMVRDNAAGEPQILQEDFYHSLLAAFTPQEVLQQLNDMGLNNLNIEMISDRHMVIYGSLG